MKGLFMKVTKFPNKISNDKKTMILGSFNSFHNGHKNLLNIAKTFKNRVIVMIIDDLSLLSKANKKEFQSLKIRLQQLSNIGVDEVIVVEFNNAIKNTSGSDFALRLKNIYNVQRFIVGKDFSMGKNSTYNSNDLKKDFETIISETITVNSSKLSTTLLSEFVEFGDVNLVKKNSPFYFTVDIEANSKNIFKIDGLTPHTGIYAS